MHGAALMAAVPAWPRWRAHAGWVVTAGVLALAATPVLAAWTQALTDQRRDGWWRPHPTDFASLALMASVVTPLSVLAAFCDPQPAWLVFALTGSVLILVDARALLLPARLLYPAAAADAALLLAYALARDETAQITRCLIAASVIGGCWFALHLLAPAALGRGDVRLTTWTAGLLGWHSWHAVVLGQLASVSLLGLTGLLAVTVAVLQHRRRPALFPFGPALIVGALLAAAASTSNLVA